MIQFLYSSLSNSFLVFCLLGSSGRLLHLSFNKLVVNQGFEVQYVLCSTIYNTYYAALFIIRIMQHYLLYLLYSTMYNTYYVALCAILIM